MEKKHITLILIALIGIYLLVRWCGGSSSEGFVYDRQYESFVGTYEVDLTIAQSGHKTTIVLNPDGTGYFQDGDSYDSHLWWPADNGGGIQFSGGGSNEQSCYYMNKSKTKMYWGLNNYMNDKNSYKVKKIK